MSPDERKEIIHNYFYGPKPLALESNWTIVLPCIVSLVLGLLLLVLSAPNISYFGLITITCSLTVLLFYPAISIKIDNASGSLRLKTNLLGYSKIEKQHMVRPSYKQVMRCLKESIDSIATESASKLGIHTPTCPPVILYGPVLWSVRGLDNADIIRRDEAAEEVFVYSTYRLTAFHFAEHFFGVYETTYNLLRDTHVGETTRELFYRDVVEVRVKSDSSNYALNTKEKIEHGKAFSLTVSSGDSIEVFINDPKLIKAGEEIESLGEAAVKNIRAMLRDYKTQTN